MPRGTVRKPQGQNSGAGTNDDPMDRQILDECAFQQRLLLEQRRTERSRNGFVLMLVEAGFLLRGCNGQLGASKLLDALCRSIRETDVAGLYNDGSTIGVIFTEIGAADGKSVAKALLSRVSDALASVMGIEEINQVGISFGVFPGNWEESTASSVMSLAMYPEAASDDRRKGFPLLAKRALDITGSIAALLVLSPVMIGIAIAVKLTSKGPALFRQKRVGQYGRWFTFLKFRSMHCDTDPKVHQEFMKNFIAGQAANGLANGQPKTIYKLAKDPRLTSIGAFLRKTSLDELPQFLNVLVGDMSLVGPRPPIPYEVDRYEIWHKRRLLPVKPGITGLWQVTARSRVGFDEMVRLDLQYARTWSLWLDIKILLQTPGAVIGGEGAF
jgi:lipopolysaccharide/colanic/teichoic acid biosynthesis glycosyltransferase